MRDDLLLRREPAWPLCDRGFRCSRRSDTAKAPRSRSHFTLCSATTDVECTAPLNDTVRAVTPCTRNIAKRTEEFTIMCVTSRGDAISLPFDDPWAIGVCAATTQHLCTIWTTRSVVTRTRRRDSRPRCHNTTFDGSNARRVAPDLQPVKSAHRSIGEWHSLINQREE